MFVFRFHIQQPGSICLCAVFWFSCIHCFVFHHSSDWSDGEYGRNSLFAKQMRRFPNMHRRLFYIFCVVYHHCDVAPTHCSATHETTIVRDRKNRRIAKRGFRRRHFAVRFKTFSGDWNRYRRIITFHIDTIFSRREWSRCQHSYTYYSFHWNAMTGGPAHNWYCNVSHVNSIGIGCLSLCSINTANCHFRPRSDLFWSRNAIRPANIVSGFIGAYSFRIHERDHVHCVSRHCSMRTTEKKKRKKCFSPLVIYYLLKLSDYPHVARATQLECTICAFLNAITVRSRWLINSLTHSHVQLSLRFYVLYCLSFAFFRFSVFVFISCRRKFN